ncbi:ATP-dependent DNA helicase DinG [Neisseria sp. Ec49-e6-T10]|uniref:ATP-dependent DNA helicase DinG n=1 Tax=Neisseria sp. Ec49-e6-T10 TaxID=3140744 RepID=UPI003EB7BE43
MLTDIEKNAIKDYYQNIAKNLTGFKPRQAQRQMIAALANAFSLTLTKSDEHEEEPKREGESLIVIEGPTGVGKSLAYLLAGSVMAKTHGKKLIISSATIALQEQLVYRDLPFVVEKSGLQINYALAKGRSRYLCPYRLYQLTHETAQDDLLGFDASFAVWDKKPKPEEISLLREIADEFSARRFNGDKDSWPQTIDEALWFRLTNDRHGCLKAACPNRAECPFYLARDLLETVDVIVVNHDLLLADISMGGGVILTEPANSFYCIDEAHRLPKKAIDQFAAEHSLSQAQWFLEKLPNLTDQVAALTDKPDLANLADEASAALIEVFAEWLWVLNDVPELSMTNDNMEPVWLWEDGQIPEALQVITTNTAIAARMLVKHLHALNDSLGNSRKDKNTENALFDRISSELGFSIAKAEQINSVWDLLEESVKEGAPPLAKWISRRQADKTDYIFQASPISAASALSHGLWQKAAGVLLTSATLQSLGNFDLFLRQTGLSWMPKTATLALESPFNFAEQGELYLPAIMASPKDSQAHTAQIIEWLPKLIDIQEAVGTLVLFSSRKQMQDVSAGLPANYIERLLVQGEMAKSALLRMHYDALDRQQSSIIFGLDSFAEGLDLPGIACVHVIIAKLPFSMPDNPVDKTMSRWIEQKGGNPFLEITVPETSMKLIQAVGRLIRTESDYGRVTILDNRIKTASYGKKLLASLPPFKRL